MNNQAIKRTIGTVLVAGLLGGTETALAYSCEAEFAKADALIEEAEGNIKPDADTRIKAMLAEAKGTLEAAKISHRQATEKHTGATGKYLHGDAVRKGRWAQALASEAIFLITGQPR